MTPIILLKNCVPPCQLYACCSGINPYLCYLDKEIYGSHHFSAIAVTDCATPLTCPLAAIWELPSPVLLVGATAVPLSDIVESAPCRSWDSSSVREFVAMNSSMNARAGSTWSAWTRIRSPDLSIA